MKVISQNKQIVGKCKCKYCDSILEVERRDLKIKNGGFLGLEEIPYIICPICNSNLTIADKDLYRFGLKRS